jgi:predicted MPP superfamily phosphohydrolase
MSGIIAAIFVRRGSQLQQNLTTWMMGLMLLALIPRLFSLPVLLIEDFTRPFRGFPPRTVLMSELTIGVAAVLSFLVLFGITRGRHFTITQITDVHSGSFTNAAGVQKGLDLVNSQHSDVILFTGDLGNHDYGDYVQWPTSEAKHANLARLKQVHTGIGSRLLQDEAITLQKDGQSITLLGIENWGKGGFHKYGDLKKATAGVPDDAFKVLMSHDPSHWEAVTLDHHQQIH